MNIILFQVNGPSGKKLFFSEESMHSTAPKIFKLMKRCFMYTAWLCQDLSVPIQHYTTFQMN
jgi:hypothetical protein